MASSPLALRHIKMRPAQRHAARFDLGAGGANPASREFDGLDLLGESGLGGEEAETIPAGERATTRIPMLCDGRICWITDLRRSGTTCSYFGHRRRYPRNLMRQDAAQEEIAAQWGRERDWARRQKGRRSRVLHSRRKYIRR
jgi:hypothetical protein